MAAVLLIGTPDADSALLATALRIEGFEVTQAATADDARALVQGSEIDVAVVDLMLKGTGGLDLAREIRVASPPTRVLLTSSYVLSERQIERAGCGASGFIPKPYDVHEVVAFVKAKAFGPPSTRTVAEAPLSRRVPTTGDGATGDDAATGRKATG